MYTNRIDRKWLRGGNLSTMTGTKEDYWQRELQHIGQQRVNNLEVDTLDSETDGTIVEEPSKEFTQSSFSSWPGIGGVVKSVAHDIGNIGWGSPGDALRAYLVRPDVVRSVSGSQNIP